MKFSTSFKIVAVIGTIFGLRSLLIAWIDPLNEVKTLESTRANSSSFEGRVVREMATFLERHPEAADAPSSARLPSSSQVTKSPSSLPFSEDFLNALETKGIKERLAEVSAENAQRLNLDINDSIRSLSEEISEKDRLIQISFWLENTYSTQVSENLYLDEVNRFYTSTHQASQEYANRALGYYFELESNPEKRERRKFEFFTEHPPAEQILAPESPTNPSESSELQSGGETNAF